MTGERTSIGLIGLGVMGRNIACNLAAHNFQVSAYSHEANERTILESQIADSELTDRITTPTSIDQFVADVPAPRVILLMVTAGDAVDEVLQLLTARLAPGDVVIDGGNSHFQDTERRNRLLARKAIQFVGAGISGGEEGARLGASIMVGGSDQAFQTVQPMLRSLAAEFGGEPCMAHLGPGGSGHFVKMVHNAIEYGAMQLIAESYQLLRDCMNLPSNEISQCFGRWTEGPLASYLMGITRDILLVTDDSSGNPLIDQISDRAGQKGTGRWAVECAMQLGIPVPGIVAAVTERQLSSSSLRTSNSASTTTTTNLVPLIENALLGSLLSMYAQGISLIKAANEAYDWQVDVISVLKLWRAGCIIRADLLDQMILQNEELADTIEATFADWRELVGQGIQCGVPLPAMSACLNYETSLGVPRLGLNLVQAQRDYFGAHTYERIDQSGKFHTDWKNI